MKLPELPKKRRHKESDITGDVIKWFEKYWNNSVALEIKIKGGKVYPHQLSALTQVEVGVFSHKIKDTGSRNPFDVFILKKADAFLVICNGRKCVAYDSTMVECFDFKV